MNCFRNALKGKSTPALKRWALIGRPFGANQVASIAGGKQRCAKRANAHRRPHHSHCYRRAGKHNLTLNLIPSRQGRNIKAQRFNAGEVR